ncbi:uncharacterized protein [Temnothorax nylanderi]|uniref:uncharacterized protein n=1 Tax=Temnothorax nylanderi TaxID=102681 RepID=UPI003A89371D
MSTELLGATIRLGILVISNELQNILAVKLKRMKRRYWVRKWIARREAALQFIEELGAEDNQTYLNMFRITQERFQDLLGMVSAKLQKQDTHMRPALSPKLKLQIVLRYLATGDSLASLQLLFRVPKCTISIFLPKVLHIIHEALKDFIKIPNTTEEWCKIEKGFAERWNFPGCVGSLDGKHVVIKKPKHSGSLYYNYKGSYSIVLMAVVDSEYIFRYIDVGALGRNSDGGIFQNSSLKRAIDGKLLNLPENFFFVGDDAFPLKLYLLKPYSRSDSLNVKKLIFNYRLSRARRIVENAFGILANRFQVFAKPITYEPKKLTKLFWKLLLYITGYK